MAGKGADVRTIAITGSMMAIVCVLIMWGRMLYIPPTQGYIHLGDVAANFAALAFGP